MIELLLAATLSASNPEGCLDDSVDISVVDKHTVAKVDLTGDKREEILFYYFSWVDSSYCVVYAREDTLTRLFDSKFLVRGGDFRLYLGDYNNDCVYDFTISPPNVDLFYYVTWNRDARRFDVVADSLFAEPAE